MLGVHNLRDDGQAGGGSCLLEQADALFMEALESIRGGPGLEGSAPENLRPGGFDALGHRDDLLLGLHGAGTGHHQKVPAADFRSVGKGDDGVLLMKFPVGVFVGLLDALDGFHNIQRQDAFDVHPGGVAHQAHDGVVGAHRLVGLQTHAVQPAVEQLHLLLFRALFQNNNHGIYTPVS